MNAIIHNETTRHREDCPQRWTDGNSRQAEEKQEAGWKNLPLHEMNHKAATNESHEKLEMSQRRVRDSDRGSTSADPKHQDVGWEETATDRNVVSSDVSTINTVNSSNSCKPPSTLWISHYSMMEGTDFDLLTYVKCVKKMFTNLKQTSWSNRVYCDGKTVSGSEKHYPSTATVLSVIIITF